MTPETYQIIVEVLDHHEDELKRQIEVWKLRGGKVSREFKDRLIVSARDQIALIARAREELEKTKRPRSGHGDVA